MTNTKILIGNITDSQGKPDETKLVLAYLSELGRINITETPYKFIKLYLNSIIISVFYIQIITTGVNSNIKCMI